MQQTLERFIKALRGVDVPVSIGESIDAHNAVELVGIADRQILKDALALVMAKSTVEKRAFAECFELFFARDIPAASADDGTGFEPAATAARDASLVDMVLAGDRTAIAAAMEGAAGRIGATEICFFTQRGIFARRMLDDLGLRDLERTIWQLQGAGSAAAAGQAEALEQGRGELLAEARAFVERQYQIYGVPGSERLRDEMLEDARLTGLETRDLARMHRLVRRMAKRLASRHSRRRKAARHGVLELRKMLRANLAYDGVPFETVWKSRRINRPRVVAICDVSRSVAAVARFLLLFLYCLTEEIADVRAFAFSNRLIEVSEVFERHEVEPAMVEILDKIGFRSTDYGQALLDFETDFADAVDRRTSIIIMGDARSNHTDPRVDIMRRLHDRAKRVIFLNPEVPTVWGSGDSEMLRYRPFCQLARECNTLKHLERVVDDLLKLYAAGKR